MRISKDSVMGRALDTHGDRVRTDGGDVNIGGDVSDRQRACVVYREQEFRGKRGKRAIGAQGARKLARKRLAVQERPLVQSSKRRHHDIDDALRTGVGREQITFGETAPGFIERLFAQPANLKLRALREIHKTIAAIGRHPGDRAQLRRANPRANDLRADQETVAARHWRERARTPALHFGRVGARECAFTRLRHRALPCRRRNQ